MIGETVPFVITEHSTVFISSGGEVKVAALVPGCHGHGCLVSRKPQQHDSGTRTDPKPASE